MNFFELAQWYKCRAVTYQESGAPLNGDMASLGQKKCSTMSCVHFERVLCRSGKNRPSCAEGNAQRHDLLIFKYAPEAGRKMKNDHISILKSSLAHYLIALGV